MIYIEWFLWLITYSFIGWVYESIVCSLGERKLVNRGFLNGPLCPVYGFGALVCIICLYQRMDNIFLLFFSGVVLTCTVEYITSVLLEKLFHMKWWDYSHYRFNIGGRVCLLGAVVFGAMSVLLVKYIHPFVDTAIGSFPDWALLGVAAILFFVLMADLYITVRHLLLLEKRLSEVQAAINKFKEEYLGRTENLKGLLLDKFEESEFYSEKIKRLLNIERFQDARISTAFPRLQSLRYNEAWKKLKERRKKND